MIVILPRVPIDPATNAGGWQPRRFERLDWIVLRALLLFIAITLLALFGMHL